MAVAVVAVVLALASLGLAGWALNKAEDANQAVAALSRKGPPPGPPNAPGLPPAGIPSTAETAEPEPGTTVTSRALDPQAIFGVKYEKRNLSIQVPVACCDERQVDLDEPRVGPSNGGDFSMEGGSSTGVPTLTFGAGATAAAAESVVTPNQCAERIQFAPLLPDNAYPVRKGDVYCILTSQAAADSSGITQKMAVASVTGISADFVVTLQVTAFDVPR